MKSIKKFWLWLTKQPYIVYVGNHRYECRVRVGPFTGGIDRDYYVWFVKESRHRHCHMSLDEAENLRFDYRLIGNLHV
jgi:hypothetical protein